MKSPNSYLRSHRLSRKVLLCLGCCGLLQTQTPLSAVDPSLKLHFDFEQNFAGGKVVDVSGNGHDGWQFCPTNWITATNGVFGGTGGNWHTNAAVTDADGTHIVSQYIGVTNLAGIDYLTNGTISFWAQFGQGSDSTTVMLDAGYSAWSATYPNLATNSWSIRRSYRPYLSFIVFDQSAEQRTIVDWPADVVQPYGSYPDYSTTSFHLYTLTFSCASNEAIAYYDGQPVMTNSIGLPWLRIYCSTPWLAIGTWAHDGTPQWGDDLYPHSGFFDGTMDELRIYNRALSAAEVQSLFVVNDYVRGLTIQLADAQSVRVSWPSQSGVSYQVEGSSSLTTSGWAPLGSPIPGNGATNSYVDSTLGQQVRLYRVRILP